MYQIGLKPKIHRRRWPLWLGLTGSLLLVVIIGVIASRHLKSQTKLSQAPAVITKVRPSSTPLQSFDEAGFEIELPSDWKLVTHLDQPYNLYHFQGSAKDSVGRILEVYKDTIPVNFAVNRVQPIEASGGKVAAVGGVSENCADFTKGPGTLGTTGAPAKWQGVSFLCDLDNVQRNVIGTSTLGGVNRVTVKGQTGTPHQFFFTYTDHSINPNYATFYGVLDSFSAK